MIWYDIPIPCMGIRRKTLLTEGTIYAKAPKAAEFTALQKLKDQ